MRDRRESNPTVDMKHPVVQSALSRMRRGTDEPYVLDEAGSAALELALLEHALDPTLAEGVRGLFCLAALLRESRGSEIASQAILCAIGRTAPRLTRIHQELAEEAAEAGRRFHARNHPCRVSRAVFAENGSAVEGTIKAGAITPRRRA